MAANAQRIAQHWLDVAGRRVETDSEGYLLDRGQWSEDFVRALAKHEGSSSRRSTGR